MRIGRHGGPLTGAPRQLPSVAVIRGLLVDFANTLFRLEEVGDSVGALLAAPVPLLTPDEGAAIVERAARAWPGAPAAMPVPDELADAYARRDLDPEQHRAAYVGLLRASGMPRPDLAEVLYERVRDPGAWRPYPDTLAALRAIRAAGLPVAVLSNIAWDVRPVLAAHGAAGLVDAVVLSMEEGVVKPDPEIFRRACARLGVPPSDVAMLGDNRHDDGGIGAVGGRYLPVPPLPPEQRPDGLLAALAGALPHP